MTSVLVVRGHLATPWELRPWASLPRRFDVAYLATGANRYEVGALPGVRRVEVRALRDRLPRGPLGEVAAGLAGDRYIGEAADAAFADADVVHAEELSFWFAADATRRKARHHYAVVQTVWETLPFLRAYRNRHARGFRDEVLAGTDLFLPATERARLALLLEGVPEERIEVCPPGIDVERFANVEVEPPDEHVILSAGRLVWEKGHADVLRAVALLAREGVRARVRIVGSGPEEHRLRAYADELGIGDRVRIGAVPYDDMPRVFARASCLVLMSLPAAHAALHPFDAPRAFWEEQFGLVFAEALASGLDVVSTTSGAIPEVLDGTGTLLAPGDWPELARVLRDGPLSRPPGARVVHPPDLVGRYSIPAMAQRLAAIYDRVVATGRRS